jgi:hypothetical protein
VTLLPERLDDKFDVYHASKFTGARFARSANNPPCMLRSERR